MRITISMMSTAVAALTCVLLGRGVAWAGAEADGTLAASTTDLAAGTSIELSPDLSYSSSPLGSDLYSSAVFPAALADGPTEAAPALPPSSKNDEWWLEPSLALWLPGIQGTLGARGLTVSGEAPFHEILGDTDSLIGIMGSFDFGRGRLGGYIGGSYMELGFEAGPLDGISIKNSVALLGFGLSYELGRWPLAYTATADKPARDLTLQGRVGGRYSAVGVDLSPANLGTVSSNEGWVDPMIGVRMSLPLSQKLSLVISGELGGFGAASDLAWARRRTVLVGLHDRRAPELPTARIPGHRRRLHHRERQRQVHLGHHSQGASDQLPHEILRKEGKGTDLFSTRNRSAPFTPSWQ